MASKLWSRQRRKTMYSDLLDHVPVELELKFMGWIQQLNGSEWNHRFLHYHFEPIKSESTAFYFGTMGDAYFQQYQWRKAMEMYNQALRFAVNDSSYFGILYAKRGFCFSNMNMYDAGSLDIELAKTQKSAPEYLAMMAPALQINNDLLKQRLQPHVSHEPKLSFHCDDNYPAMANVLELKYDTNQRPYIAAKVDIDVGKTVLLEESFVAIANSYDKTCCATCLHEIRNFVPCPSCTDSVFCSVDCLQRNHIHQSTCGAEFHRMPTPIQFVIQSILQAISICPTTEFLMHFVETHIMSSSAATAAATFNSPLDAKLRDYGLFLKQNVQNGLSMVVVQQVYTTLLSMGNVLRRFPTMSKQRFLMHLIGHHIMVLKNNAFGGFEANQNRFISATMANLVAIIEHSCTPNVVHFAYGNREVCITVRPIRAGEHLCYDYCFDGGFGDSKKNAEERHQQLWNNWRIDCNCLKCSTHGNIPSNLQMASDASFFFGLEYKRQANNERLKQKCVHFLRKHKDAAWTKEMEFITKVYSQCLIDEYNKKYGPPNGS